MEELGGVGRVGALGCWGASLLGRFAFGALAHWRVSALVCIRYASSRDSTVGEVKGLLISDF